MLTVKREGIPGFAQKKLWICRKECEFPFYTFATWCTRLACNWIAREPRTPRCAVHCLFNRPHGPWFEGLSVAIEIHLLVCWGLAVRSGCGMRAFCKIKSAPKVRASSEHS
jgi:hypothetical protein